MNVPHWSDLLYRSLGPRRQAQFLLTAFLLGNAGAAFPAQQKPDAKPAKQAEPKPANGNAKPPDAPAPQAQPVSRPAPADGAPQGMIKLDFRGTDIDTVLQAYAMAYNWTVVKDPALTGPVTILETKPMVQARALQILQAVLEVKGFTALLDDGILKVLPTKKAVTSSTEVRIPAPNQGSRDPGQIVTEIISLSNAEASQLSKDLQPLLSTDASIIGASGANALIITDRAANIDRLKLIIKELDKGAGNNEIEIFHLQHVESAKMVSIINDLFKAIAPRQPAAAPNPNQPQPPPQPGQPGAPSAGRPAVTAVQDERTNSVIVVGSKENLERVNELVTKLDKELNPQNETKVYEVKYAEASKLAELIYNGLVGKEPGSQSSQGGFNPFGFNPFERRAQGTQTTSFQTGQTRIVADTRTNTLIITADADTMKVVDDLLEKLDKPVEYETTTFSIPLKNTNAEDMAYVLGQAFATNQRNNRPYFFDFFGNQNNSGNLRRDRRIKRRVNDQNSSNSAGPVGPEVAASTGFRPEGPGGTHVADATLPPEMTPGAYRIAQYYYDYYGDYYGGGQRGSNATTGRNSEGKYVNLLQLRGNVLVTPERNTNSLVITTTPEMAQAVKDLVNQLDVEVKQVLLEAIVAEVTLDKSTRFGLQYILQDLHNKLEGVFPVLPGAGPISPTDPLSAGLRYTIVRGDVTAVLTAIGRDDKIHILSTPRVFTSNNQQAEIEVTDHIPYLQGTTIGFGGQSSSSVAFLDVGLILNVTPRITAEKMVAVDVYQEDSNLVEFRNVGNGAVAPLTTQRVTDTSVTLRDGDTLILGGLQKTAYQNTVNKIPILGDIPILGKLFSNTAKTRNRTELVVFLTPRVINGADDAKDLSDQELHRVQQKLPEVKSNIPTKTPLTEPDRNGDGKPDRDNDGKEPGDNR